MSKHSHRYVNGLIEQLSIDPLDIADMIAEHFPKDNTPAEFYLHRYILEKALARLTSEQIQELTTCANGDTTYPYSYDLEELRDMLASIQDPDKYVYWLHQKLAEILTKRA